MLNVNVGAKTAHIAKGITDSQVESGNSIIVYGILVAQDGGNGIVTVKTGDASSTILTLGGGLDSTYVMNIPFFASDGISITTPSDVNCSIIYSQAGA